MAKRAGYTAVISHRSRRDRRLDDRRHRGRHQRRPDQDRLDEPLATASPSTTSCCASRKTSATSPATRAAPRSTTCAEPPAPPAPTSTIALIALLALVQARALVRRRRHAVHDELQLQLAAQRRRTTQARARNDRLAAEVSDLKEGLEMVEEKARSELGMVKPDEMLVQVARRPLTRPRMSNRAPGCAPAARAGVHAAGRARSPGSRSSPSCSRCGWCRCNMRVRPARWPLAIAARCCTRCCSPTASSTARPACSCSSSQSAAWGWWQWLRGHGADGGALRVRRLAARPARPGRRDARRLAAARRAAAALHRQRRALPRTRCPPSAACRPVAARAQVIENWPVWIAVNVVSVALFAFKAPVADGAPVRAVRGARRSSAGAPGRRRA